MVGLRTLSRETAFHVPKCAVAAYKVVAGLLAIGHGRSLEPDPVVGGARWVEAFGWSVRVEELSALACVDGWGATHKVTAADFA